MLQIKSIPGAADRRETISAHICSKMKLLDAIHKEKKRVKCDRFNACLRKHEVLSNKVFWLYNVAYLSTITVAFSRCYCMLLLWRECVEVLLHVSSLCNACIQSSLEFFFFFFLVLSKSKSCCEAQPEMVYG